jgi:hypothetical protein
MIKKVIGESDFVATNARAIPRENLLVVTKNV